MSRGSKEMLRAFVMASAFCSAGMAWAAPDAVVVWPEGWEVSELPPAGLSAAAGTRTRAFKQGPEGRPIAVMEWTRLRRTDRGQARLAQEFEAISAPLQRGFRESDLDAECSDAEPGRWNGLDSLKMRCEVEQESERILSMEIEMALGESHVHSVSYATTPDVVAKYRDEFAALRASLPLD